MKETMQQHLHTAERKIIQNMIRREYDGWPPQSATFFYQPHRPKKKPAAAQPQTPSKCPHLSSCAIASTFPNTK